MTQKTLLETKVKDLIFNIFDTETTGNNSFRKDEPIEIAYAHFNYEKGILKHYQTLVDTDLIIHPAAIMTHGITNEQLKSMDRLDYATAIQTISPDFENVIPVAHNIEFDYSMLPEIRKDEEISLDTLVLARKLYKIGDLNEDNMPLTSHKMQELRYWLKLEVNTLGFDAHRALADILVTADVFKHMLKTYLELTRDKDATLQDLKNFMNAVEPPKLIKDCQFKKYEGRTFEEAIKECLQNGDNYFDWLLDKLKADPTKNKDLIYTINHWFSEYGYNPELSFKNKKSASDFFKKGK